ncbi:hypothetical protein HDU98_011350, partial [Podochytrium sp. JEL0797]
MTEAASADRATAVTKANSFAQLAEEYGERGQHAQAIEAHFRAAELFLVATTHASDPEAARTLRMLYASHTRRGKDLQRRLLQSDERSAKKKLEEPPPPPPPRLDDISATKLAQRHKLAHQGMWADNFEGQEEMSGYASRHFFAGQGPEGAALLDAATVPVESLDVSVVQPRVPRSTETYRTNQQQSISDAMDSYYVLDETQADAIPK